MKRNTSSTKSNYLLIMAGIAVGMLTAPAAFAQNQNNQDSQNPFVTSPQSAAYGNTYGGWATLWWQHMTSLTGDPTANCGANQSGPVWFLAESPFGGTQNLHCTVPAGKAIFLPIINVECSTQEQPLFPSTGVPNGNFGCTDEENCRRCATTYGDHIRTGPGYLNASVDGVPVTNLTAYRTATPSYTFTAANNNLFINPTQGNGGRGTSVSDGYWLLVRPLVPGTHTIQVHGAFDSTVGNFTENVLYTITVTP
ncbi:hypothetical protein [Cupriavidus sp. CuC1]|uniref:hypothetical protein n=1 Tax=Cupriavidus sp. CuC1 TaxID=3373131 RepID=UPI0037D597E9